MSSNSSVCVCAGATSHSDGGNAHVSSRPWLCRLRFSEDVDVVHDMQPVDVRAFDWGFAYAVPKSLDGLPVDCFWSVSVGFVGEGEEWWSKKWGGGEDRRKWFVRCFLPYCLTTDLLYASMCKGVHVGVRW